MHIILQRCNHVINYVSLSTFRQDQIRTVIAVEVLGIRSVGGVHGETEQVRVGITRTERGELNMYKR